MQSQQKNSINPLQHLSHPSYRPDIDGLRALAVLSVIIFHAFPTVFKGGFIGVDIFFVISGFLISTIIFTNLHNKSFSFIEFYSRRVRRIFPSLLVVLIATLSFGYFSMSADEYSQLGKHVAGGTSFISNILLWNESGYFDRSSDLKPLLHLWSLGIEEQFYIAWPLIIWLAWQRKLNILAVTVAIFILSFSFNLFNFRTDPTEDFYSPFTRFWELLTGGITAYFLSRRAGGPCDQARCLSLSKTPINFIDKISSKKTLTNSVSILGGALILTGLAITREKDFPGFWALIPTIGAALTISAGKDAWFNKYILSNRNLIFIGLISFPLYLWHWPILSYGTILFGETPPVFFRFLCVIASIFLAWGTYILIEQPIRSGRYENYKTASLSTILVLTGCIGYFIHINDGFRFRYPVHDNDQEIRAWHLKGSGIIDCGYLVKETTSAFCAKTKKARVAIIGDSHAGHLFYGFSRSTNKDFNQVMVIGAGSCQPTLGFEAREGCNNQLQVAINSIISDDNIKYVVLAGYHGIIENNNADTSRKYIDGMQATLNKLKTHGKTIIFIIDNPSLKESAERCQPQPFKLREFFISYPSFCKNLKKNDFRDQNTYRQVINVIKKKNPDVFFFDPIDALCFNNECKLYKNNKLLYGDWNHLSIYGSQSVVNTFINAYTKNRLE